MTQVSVFYFYSSISHFQKPEKQQKSKHDKNPSQKRKDIYPKQNEQEKTRKQQEDVLKTPSGQHQRQPTRS